MARVLLGAGAPLNARLRTDGVLLGPGLLSTLGRCGQDRFSRCLRTGAPPLHIAAPRATHHLHWAASGDAVAAVEVLLSHGASIHARADDGSKPLDAAAARHAWRAGRAVAVERRQYGDDARRRRRLLPGYRFGDGALTRARPTTSGLSRTGTGIRDGE